MKYAATTLLALAAAVPVTLADVPSYGIDFVTVGAPGNAACYLGENNDVNYSWGRGSVGYEYRIGRTEITTAQWMNFFNTVSPLGGQWTNFGSPVFWGAERDFSYHGPGYRMKLRTDVPNAGMLPVGGSSWREAAVYCNWLCNRQTGTVSALSNGAYDISTFGDVNGRIFTDQLTHNPGAQFWIPTYDEWIKAAHYDPNRFGHGQQGWWTYSTTSDTQPTYGPPGQGQVNAGFELPDFAEWEIPLGAYAGVTSPWGLLDAAGGTREWTELVADAGSGPEERGIEGSGAGLNLNLSILVDGVTSLGSALPRDSVPTLGFRIASAVPCVGTTGTSFIVIMASGLFRRRRE